MKISTPKNTLRCWLLLLLFLLPLPSVLLCVTSNQTYDLVYTGAESNRAVFCMKHDLSRCVFDVDFPSYIKGNSYQVKTNLLGLKNSDFLVLCLGLGVIVYFLTAILALVCFLVYIFSRGEEEC